MPGTDITINDEFGSVDFSQLIGGPMNAMVEAQAKSAMTSVDFIKSVGFENSEAGGKCKTITFTYTKPVQSTDGAGQTTITAAEYELTVPLLTMVPIPFVRIETGSINFNAKVTGTIYSKLTTSDALDATLKAGGRWGPFSANLSANYVHKSEATSGASAERTYTMNVDVRVVQDAVPAGVERVLGLLERTISDKPKG